MKKMVENTSMQYADEVHVDGGANVNANISLMKEENRMIRIRFAADK